MSKYVKIDQVAEHLNLSVPTIRMWMRKKVIPTSTYYKVGNTYRFHLERLEQKLLSGELDAAATKSNEPEESVDDVIEDIAEDIEDTEVAPRPTEVEVEDDDDDDDEPWQTEYVYRDNTGR